MNNGKNRQIITRFYNQISFKGNRVFKGAPESRYQNEITWFEAARSRIPDNIPHIYCYDKKVAKNDSNLKFYEMQAIEGDNLYNWVIDNNKNFSEIFDRLVNLTNNLHQETYPPKFDDIYQMYFVKPRLALTDFINQLNIDTNEIIINGQCYADPIKQLESVYKQLEKQLQETRFTFIHGDLTMSNTLIDNNKKLYLIDPRGCFGNTSLFGDVRYDIAKIFYSFVGNFDSLNNNRFSYQEVPGTKNSHQFSIENNGIGDYSIKIVNEFHEQMEVIKFIHATIWLSLIPHVANNPKQQWCTFCQGVYLINTVFTN